MKNAIPLVIANIMIAACLCSCISSTCNTDEENGNAAYIKNASNDSILVHIYRGIDSVPASIYDLRIAPGESKMSYYIGCSKPLGIFSTGKRISFPDYCIQEDLAYYLVRVYVNDMLKTEYWGPMRDMGDTNSFFNVHSWEESRRGKAHHFTQSTFTISDADLRQRHHSD
jgi:hypothetical protein